MNILITVSITDNGLGTFFNTSWNIDVTKADETGMGCISIPLKALNGKSHWESGSMEGGLREAANKFNEAKNEILDLI